MSTVLYEKLSKTDREWTDRIVQNISSKLKVVRERSANKIPSETIEGVHDNKLLSKGNVGLTRGFWTNGFWSGMLWQMYQVTGDERYSQIARFTQSILDECLLEEDTHDIGFLWLPSAVCDYKLTGNEKALKSGLTAAKWLMGRFNPAGNYIRAWGGGNEKIVLFEKDSEMNLAGVAIIDCMMNLPLLYWASEITGDPRFYHAAVRHADKAMEYFVREDGSTVHIVEFDPNTGEYVNEFGGQGYGKGSSWARGTGWGLYGFIASYNHTAKKEYLHIAKKVAAYIISNLPDSGLVPCDFCQPSEPWVQDDIAAGVIASGLLELAKIVPEESSSYLNTAVKILQAIDRSSADWSLETDNITLRGTAGYHLSGRNKNYIYGDYYYMEAVFKLKGLGIYIW